jgi:hypothetical protein
MAFNPQEKQASQISLPAEGTVPARLARIVELGQRETTYKGITKVKDQVQFWYTLPTRLIEDEGDYQGKQHMIRTRRMQKTTSEKGAIMEHIAVLDKNATSFESILNKPCYVRIVHNTVTKDGDSRQYANITGIMGVPEGMTVGDADTTPFHFDFYNPSEELWQDVLWDGLKEDLQKAVNYKGSALERMVLKLEATA